LILAVALAVYGLDGSRRIVAEPLRFTGDGVDRLPCRSTATSAFLILLFQWRLAGVRGIARKAFRRMELRCLFNYGIDFLA